MDDTKEWRKILVVEDEERCKKQIKEAFNSHSREWEVSFVSTSKDALNRVLQDKFDLILLSYELPDDSGLEFLRKLKSNPKIALPVILMAHDTSEEAREKAMRVGVLDFVVEPLLP